MEKFSAEDLIRDITEWIDKEDEEIGAATARDIKAGGLEGIQMLTLRALLMLTMDIDWLKEQVFEIFSKIRGITSPK